MKPRDRGSALVITLVLLSGLGALALAAAAAAMTALALAGHQQMSQNAFEAAETGIVHALTQAAAVRGGGTNAGTIRQEDPTASAAYQTVTSEAEGPGPLPDGFSIGKNAGTFAAQSFYVTADAQSGRSTRARLEQGFYLVVPTS